jgi:hypothetical protein
VVFLDAGLAVLVVADDLLSEQPMRATATIEERMKRVSKESLFEID